MDRRQHIEDKLRSELEPVFIEVIDESHLHAGHEGAKSGGGHYRATIVSPKFAGLRSVAAQRLVYKTLREEMTGMIHALSLDLVTPEDWEARS
jgi:BolA protein